MAIVVGKRFASYEELANAIKEYEEEKKITLWKRESKTLKSVEKKYLKIDEAKDSLRYYYIKYSCTLGGRKHRKQVIDNSRQSNTFRQDCPAFINVLLSSDRQFLEIRAIGETHNHIVSDAMFNQMPKIRRLDDDSKEEIRKLMDLQVNKKLLQEKMQKKTGKNVTLQDISNIVSGQKGPADFNEGQIVTVSAVQPVDNVEISISDHDYGQSVSSECVNGDGINDYSDWSKKEKDHMACHFCPKALNSSSECFVEVLCGRRDSS